MKRFESMTWTVDYDSVNRLLNVLANAELWLPDQQLKREAALLRCEIGVQSGAISAKDAEFIKLKHSLPSSDFLSTVQRLPVVNDKIVLDRDNLDHVRWDESNK